MKRRMKKENRSRKRFAAAFLGGAIGLLASASGCGTATGDGYVEVPEAAREAGIVFQEGKREADFRGVTVFLNYPFREGRVHAVDLPFLNDPEPKPAAVPPGLILLDPGHGGREKGAKGEKFLEKDLNLALALELAEALRKEGYQVALTRETDETVLLKTRSETAKKLKAGLFISLHHNGSATAGRRGIETYSITPAGAASTNTPEEIDEKSYPGNRYGRESRRLAILCMRELLASGVGPDRGARHARFAVLRNAPCPAVLLELGFVTTPEEEKLLDDPDRRSRIIASIVRAVKAF